MKGAPTDRRVLRSNGEVAHLSLRGRVEARRFAESARHSVAVPVTPIIGKASPFGPRERELAFGEAFEVLDIQGGLAFGWAARDGYVGYVAAEALSERSFRPTHRVISPSYWMSEPRLKCGYDPERLPIGALVKVFTTHRDHCDWAEVDLPPTDPDMKGGAVYVPMPTLAPLGGASDLVAEAERYLGVPYLWGGNSGWGIDCSGLVQAACLACGIACPGDSDQQAAKLGEALAEDADLRRGDLIFWKGHVALVVGDGRILHANARDMMVAYEDMAAALARIEAAEGPVTVRRRVV
ncbi:NlpC/P60 family protein [Pseudooceanicola sp.]|uniref:C40 family peptidase n=1 Tax=Pseudooceanicola sp. TaxID=1914328 RepID=UPI0035C73094